MRSRRAREPTARYAVPRRVMVDSSVLIDVLDPDPVWFEWSAKHLAPLVDEGALVINPIIYAELAAGHTTLEALDAAIAPYRCFALGGGIPGLAGLPAVPQAPGREAIPVARFLHRRACVARWFLAAYA